MFAFVDDYFKSLYKELEYKLQNKTIETVFIGGGTPSSVNASYYEPIFKMLPKGIKEITIEANPNSATQKWQEKIAKIGVTRISFGVQSFQQDKLDWLNRAHSKKDALNAIHSAKQNFQRVSMDLIYNCPNDTKALIENDLNTFLRLGIEHISCYELTPEANTKFENLELKEDIFSNIIASKLNENGYKQYEVSNYGNPSLHNLGYWQYKEYMGVGAGAIGYEKGVRYTNEKDINRYINNPFLMQKELLTQEDTQMEKIFLGLRSSVGFVSNNAKITKRAQELVLVDKLIKKDNRYYNTNFFLSDEIALYLLK